MMRRVDVMFGGRLVADLIYHVSSRGEAARFNCDGQSRKSEFEIKMETWTRRRQDIGIYWPSNLILFLYMLELC